MVDKKRFLPLLVATALLAGLMLTSACSGVTLAQVGDTVKVLYTGTFDDGEVFDSSELHGGDPLEFAIGAGQLLPGFEQAVVGMSVGESTTVHIPADEAYGPLEVVLDLDQFPQDDPPEVGQQYYVQLENGRMITATVTDISNSSVALENTHQLAGKDLNFEIQLVEIL